MVLKRKELPLVGVTSRRIVIWRAKLQVLDLTPLPVSQAVHKSSIKMLDVLELKNLSGDDLKKKLAEQVDLEDWTDECRKCG